MQNKAEQKELMRKILIAVGVLTYAEKEFRELYPDGIEALSDIQQAIPDISDEEASEWGKELIKEQVQILLEIAKGN